MTQTGVLVEGKAQLRELETILNLDVSFLKNVRFKEAGNVQFRAVAAVRYRLTRISLG